MAVAYQKSPSVSAPGDVRPASTRRSATRRAPGHVSAPASGDHRADSRSVDAVGSYIQTFPCPRRQATVSWTRSPFTEAATTGPCHSSRAGTASPVVLKLWVGPTTRSEWPASTATRRPQARPRVRRPATGARTTRQRRSPRRAQRAPSSSVTEAPPFRARRRGAGTFRSAVRPQLTAVDSWPTRRRPARPRRPRRRPPHVTQALRPGPIGSRRGHRCIGVDQSALDGRQSVLDQERPTPDLPQRHSPLQMGNELGLGGRQPEEVPGPFDLPRRLRVDDPGLGVGQQPLGQPDLLGTRWPRPR